MIKSVIPSWIAGIILSFATGPFGSLMIWHRMSYFGDTLAHASLLGLSFSILFHTNLFLTVIITAFLLALTLISLDRFYVEIDTLLSIISNGTLSLGLIIINYISKKQVNFMSYLFGDLAAISINDILKIIILVLIVIFILIWKWNEFLSITINSEISYVEGINYLRIKTLLVLSIGLIIGISMKFVGALIINSLLVIPAATARQFSRSPEQMIFLSVIIGMLSVTIGLIFSEYFNIPACPSIVLISTIIFLFSILKRIFL